MNHQPHQIQGIPDIHTIHHCSRHQSHTGFTTPSIDIELFAGAGGLTLGLTSAGFAPDHIFEIDDQCCDTLRRNSQGDSRHITAEIHQEDVGTVDWSKFDQSVRLLAGGPPCQPFSTGGKHLADRDVRDQFPAVFRAVDELRPQIVLIENVPGLIRDSFRPYLDYIIRQLEYPSVTSRPDATWRDQDEHLRELIRSRTRSPDYRVCHWLLNVADYGIAQARVRLIIVAVRSDLRPVHAPAPTHSREVLVDHQRNGTYWRNRNLPEVERSFWPRRAQVQIQTGKSNLRPWVTVRDALSGLPEPPIEDVHGENHWFIPGARLYRGHTGSELDWPAKTIKAGVHGVSGGENILRLDNGEFRYFTLREMARLQGYPDDYIFIGSRSRIIRQIGNAVPCRLGYAIGAKLGHAFRPNDTTVRS